MENFKFLVESAPEIPPEQQKEKEALVTPEMIKVAENALRDFVALKESERVKFLKDKKTNPATLNLLQAAIKSIGCESQEIRLSKRIKKDLPELTKESVIIDLGGESGLVGDLYDELPEINSRLLALYDASPDVFRADGPMSERREDLENRLNKMDEVLRDATGFKITSGYGTDLKVPLRMAKERKWFKDSGAIDTPGRWDNLPGGEIYICPDEEKVSGVLVLPVLDSEISGEQGVDKFVRVKIYSGKIILIQGGESAQKLRQILEESAKEEHEEGSGNPWNVYTIAEIAFGANSKARSVVRDENQPYNFAGTPTVEAEKRLGTMHLAFGDAKHGEEEAEGFREAVSHFDFVIPRNGLTVEMFTNEGDFERGKNGRKIINDGNWSFF